MRISNKKSLREDRIYACETVKDIEDLWYKIAGKASRFLNERVDSLSIFVEDLNPEDTKDLNSIAETRAEISKEDASLSVKIYFDPSFFSLTTLYQVGTICHEMGHAENSFELYEKLLLGEISVDEWNEEAESDGHTNDWRKIVRNIAIANNVKPEIATIEKIDFTDDSYFQSRLADI